MSLRSENRGHSCRGSVTLLPNTQMNWWRVFCLLCLLLVRLPDEVLSTKAPSFPRNLYSLSIPEDLDIGGFVVSVSATDGDDPATPDGQITYRFRKGRGHPNFNINSTSGVVTLAASLDREQKDDYMLIVEAVDGEFPPQTGSAVVRIVVRDVNDNAPRFPVTEYRMSVFDDAPGNGTVARVQAVDQDQPGTKNSRIRYVMGSGSDNGTFTVDAVTGDVVLTRPVNFDRRRTYLLEIVAWDEGDQPLRSVNNATVHIDVLTSRYLPPIFERSFYIFNVSENGTVPSHLGRIAAKYFNWKTNGTLVYSLEAGNDRGSFNLTPDGNLLLIQKIDREMASVHNLVVAATDARNSSYFQTTTVTIVVTDVNDNSPQLLSSQRDAIRISQNFPVGSLLYNVSCTDKDSGRNGLTSISLRELDSSGLFGMVSGGQITLVKQLDVQLNTTYRVLVICSDHGIPSLSQGKQFVIDVILVNDHPPYFIGAPYVFNASEATPSGSAVFKVTAHDDDRGPDGIVKYSLVDSSDTFRVDVHNGTVYTKSALDREQQTEYMLTVVATDQGRQQRSSKASVTVQVSDVNDNVPYCSDTSFDVVVSEHMAVDNVAVNFNCTDKDAGRNALLVYKIVKASSPGVFDVTSFGDIVLKTSLETRTDDVYTFAVRVSNGGFVVGRSVNVTSTVRVSRVNDHSPEFPGSKYFTKEISEDAEVNKAVMQITATDDDVGPDGQLSYEIVGGTGMGKFRIDADGRILLTRVLDSENGDNELTLIVKATDGGKVDSKSAEATVKFIIKDVDDNLPVLSVTGKAKVELLSTDPIGKLVLNVSCRDPDVTGDVLKYSLEQIIPLLNISLLKIDDSGRVTVGSSLADVPKMNGTVVVKCWDEDQPGKTASKSVEVLITPIGKPTSSMLTSEKATSSELTTTAKAPTAPGSDITLIVAAVGAVVGAVVAIFLIVLVVWLCRWKGQTTRYDVKDARVETHVNNTALAVELKSKKLRDDSDIELDTIGKEKKQADGDGVNSGLRTASSMPVVQVLQAKQETHFLLEIIEDPTSGHTNKESRLRRSVSSSTPGFRGCNSPARRIRPPSVPVHPDRLRSLQSDGSVPLSPSWQPPDNRRLSAASCNVPHLEPGQSTLSLPSAAGTESHV